MAWERRNNGAEYFYLSRRLPGGRVQRLYLGNGIRAEIESHRLEIQAEARCQIRSERQRTTTGERLLNKFVRNNNDIVHALMLTIGYSNERSRGWRRIPVIARNDKPKSKNGSNTELTRVDQFSELVKKARRGDRSVIPALRRMMLANPELAKNNGDLASQTQIHWIDLIAGQDLFRRECLLMKMAEFKRELIADTNGAVAERMLVDQVISTWLQLYYHEDREATQPAENIQLGEFRLKKIESAFNRHLKSLGALAALKAVKFTDRMKASLSDASLYAGSTEQQARTTSNQRLQKNRLGRLFSQSLEPVPSN